ncbi:AMP-binding protein [Alkalimarinus coralli]|uniref:AMP-binding protein n=1 Tax=Alkalimarinus coralli TaxID=2935863 RepID=UPI00202B3127|nr:AMP-binding protein [Alkalimarinus coralli]
MSKKAKSHIKKKGKSPEAPINQAESAERLIELISEMLKELHPRKSHALNVRLDSSLDKDLGFDSLSKVELITRVENVFSIKLPEQILTRSQTPDDILASIIQTSKNSTGSVLATAFKAPLLDVVNGAPAQASTLPEMLRWHTGAHPDRTHIFLYGEGDEPEQITYNDLLKGAEQYSVGLRNKNLQAGQTVAIMLPTGKDYLFSFFGVLLAGGVPVPIYPPANLYQLEDHVKRHVGILQNAQCSILITVPEAKKTAGLIKAQVESIHSIIVNGNLILTHFACKTAI